MAFVLAGTVLPAQAAPTVPAAPTVDPAKVVIDAAAGVQQYRFPLVVPAGGSLMPADPAAAAQGITSEVLVVDAKGAVVGAYDSAAAVDSAGRLLPTYFSIEGSTLVQTVAFDATTVFPVAIDPAYSKAGRVAVTPPPPGGFGTAAYVGVPSNYVYNPRLGARHDYCTSSPDEFPNPVGANANFRGPCARHDLCYGSGTSHFTCDNRLWSDMVSNCDHAYAWYNPVRRACYETANIYWGFVVAT
jgi:hypothetical protein